MNDVLAGSTQRVYDVSVVIPTLNEANSIAQAVRSALLAGAAEVIVCDGGSQDDTVEIATTSGASKIIRSLPGRGIQLNSGAMFAKSRYLLFLHADTWLHPNCLAQIIECEDVLWGAFQQRIDADGWLYRFVERGNAMRVRILGMAFGDQAIFVLRSKYKEIGGFEEITLMEDVAFSGMMRKIAKPMLLAGPLTISARRWQKHGILRQTLRNWWLQLAYRIGVSPDRLEKWYS